MSSRSFLIASKSVPNPPGLLHFFSQNKDELSRSGQNLEIHDIPAGNESITSPHFGSQASLRPQTTPQTDLETNVNAEPSINTEEDEQEGKSDGKTQNSQDSFSFFSQEFARAFSPTTSDLSEESAAASTPLGYETTGAEPLATTADPSIAEDGRELELGGVEDSKASSVFSHEAQQHMAQRWRTRLGHTKVMATGNGKNPFINRRNPDSRNATQLHAHATRKGEQALPTFNRATLTERLRNIRELKR